jgi:hypothetical protein
MNITVHRIWICRGDLHGRPYVRVGVVKKPRRRLFLSKKDGKTAFILRGPFLLELGWAGFEKIQRI